MAGIVFMSILVGLIAAGSALLAGASIGFALFAYAASGAVTILMVIVLTVVSNLAARTFIGSNA